MNNERERIYWLAWSQIKGVGPILLRRIQEHFGNLERGWQAPGDRLIQVEGLGNKLVNLIEEQRPSLEPEKFFDEHARQNPSFWTPSDDQYPRLLREIPSSPPILYYSGNVKLEENQGSIPLIGIVGTREPTEHGRRWTYEISKALAQHGFTVVSGLAAGIDAIAHRGCLDGGGRTVAVLGNGLDIAYPPSNRNLMAEIREKGLILSEYPQNTPPERGNFPARNRIVAGLCRAVLVMEAPEKSGALITAKYANEFNRDVYTLPNSPDNLKARGCLRLIHRGAEVIITQQELLSMLGAIPDLDGTSPQLSLFPTPLPETIPPLEPPLSTVYDAIATSPTSFDAIIAESGLSAPQVSGILLQLELEGSISQLPGMCYQRVR